MTDKYKHQREVRHKHYNFLVRRLTFEKFVTITKVGKRTINLIRPKLAKAMAKQYCNNYLKA